MPEQACSPLLLAAAALLPDLEWCQRMVSESFCMYKLQKQRIFAHMVHKITCASMMIASCMVTRVPGSMTLLHKAPELRQSLVPLWRRSLEPATCTSTPGEGTA